MIVTWSSSPGADNMPEHLLLETAQLIKRHPWWMARAKLAGNLLTNENVLPPARILDTGCGWGTNIAALEKRGYQVDGLDVSRKILEAIDRPDRMLFEADLTQNLPHAAHQYDALLALDVIEHIDDDNAVLKRLTGLVATGGVLIASVPALPELYSEFDRVQGHRRRYTPEMLREAFKGTGLTLKKIFWWGQWMVPVLRRMRRAGERQTNSPTASYTDYLRLPPWPIPFFMRLALAMEEGRAINQRLRVGTSLFAVASAA